MNTNAYLERICFNKFPCINLDTLIQLHECHVTHVPFENLDIHNDKNIKLEESHLFQKIVKNVRGGFCYEVNYLFQLLLTNIGFDSYIISAQIFDNDQLGPEFDHMALIIKLNNAFWLADVGFGDLFVKPLNINKKSIQFDGRNYFKIKALGKDSFLLLMSDNETDFEKKYKFDINKKKITQFHEQCSFKQSSSQSYFVKNKVVTRVTPKGRKTIFNSKYINKQNGVKKELIIKNLKHELQILKENFNISIL